MGFIDLHCDTLHRAWVLQAQDITSLQGSMVDVERLDSLNNLDDIVFYNILAEGSQRSLAGGIVSSGLENVLAVLSFR